MKPDNIAHLIKEIAEFIDCGLVCHINKDTWEIEAIPKLLLEEWYSDDKEEFKDRMAELYDHVDVKFLDWENPIEMEPLPSFEAFKIMEQYIEQLSDDDYKEQLLGAIYRKSPFYNFRYIIDSSPYRENWYKLKKAYLKRIFKGEIDF